MSVQISAITGMEFHINSWVDDEDYLILVASLFPNKHHPIPGTAHVNLNLLFLPSGTSLNDVSGGVKKLHQPDSRANHIEYDWLSFLWDENNLKYAS